MQYEVNGNELIVNGISTKFNAPISQVDQINHLIIVLLDCFSGNGLDYTNTLYAVGEDGKVVWKMQDVRKVIGKQEIPDPLVAFRISDNTIYASDFCSRRYFVNPENGKIFDRDVVGW